MTNVDFDELVEFGPERKGKDLIYRLDCDKANRDLLWENKTPLKIGVEKVQDWISLNLKNLNNQSCEYIHKIWYEFVKFKYEKLLSKPIYKRQKI